ncbi:MAG: malonyl-CoA decarboxylase [Rhodospirillales bacterium]|nr:malonyl-CoA decarboxylase [Rhodospirillales bacterium]
MNLLVRSPGPYMTEQKPSSFWDRALSNLRGIWGKIASGTEDVFAQRTNWSPDLDDRDQERLIEQMRACLEARGGEVSARARAAALGHAYLAFNETGRKRFLRVLADSFDIDRRQVDEAVVALQAAVEPAKRRAAEAKLRRALLASRVKLLTQFNALPEGVKFLVDLRNELLDWSSNEPSLADLEGDLKSLLGTWFDVGFLELRQITWSAPASLLEKLFEYEKVQEIRSWVDLKNRLAADRRCFAFFHPRMPDEPLIFVWVALVRGMATNVQVLLDENAPQDDPIFADTAIFYSISNAQEGLRGINFGNFLIKRVLDRLSAELKGLKTFATLSPIPGFMSWVKKGLTADDMFEIVPEAERNALTALAGVGAPEAALKALLATPNWHMETAVADVLKTPVLRLVAHYLIDEKRSGGTARDSVAHFHLNNGARIEQLNWLANTSPRGLEESAGVMLNYCYEPEQIEANHEFYRGGHAVMASPKVRELLVNKQRTNGGRAPARQAHSTAQAAN